jgi:3-carboxy-cis,cis-muconate cycloisomerase
MGSLIRDRASSTPEMLEAFGDAALVQAALAFEAALARALAAEGLIPDGEAQAVLEACRDPVDVAELAGQAAHAGTLAIPLVAGLRERAGRRDPAAAAAVHLGATSQDVADTALMLQVARGHRILQRDLRRIADALETLARAHAATPMLARTLLQPAAPTTFGLKAAQWRLLVADASRRLAREAADALLLQLGGAAGTLAGFQGKAQAVVRRVAAELGLRAPPGPWHARRDGLAGLGASLAIAVGSVAKIALDVALMAQAEVGEAFEPVTPGRGVSSAMPHKRNPTGCQVALSAAVRAPHLAATLISAMPGEHERGVGGWQAQAPVLAELFEIAHGAVAAMAQVVEGLEVAPAAMARNLAAASVGGDAGQAEALVGRLLEEAGPWSA